MIKDRYYDKKNHGIDLDERFKLAKQQIKSLDANWQIFRLIAQLVLEFDDSHTRFYPPNRSNKVEYGFSMQMVGEDCIVMDVSKDSDAEVKGLKVGDKIIAVEDFSLRRDNLWKMKYLIYDLDPQAGLKVSVVSPKGISRSIEITASLKSIKDQERELKKRLSEKPEAPYKCQEVDLETLACKLKTFSVEQKFIDDMIKEANKHKKLILDLRGNRGGLVSIEQHLTGYFFDHDVKIATFVTRNKSEDRIAKTRKNKVFKGDLVVLIDSDSASASEVFARTIQLEKRGKIVGDVSAGAVMTSNFISLGNPLGHGYRSRFGLSVTIADLIMSDGNRLEKVGVVPDYPVGPSQTGLGNRSDPVLAYAASLLGATITPSAAGKFYFLLKKTETSDDELSTDDDPKNL